MSFLRGKDKQQNAKPLSTMSRRCDAGHPMATDWFSCPYCEAAQKAAERTRVNTAFVSPTSAQASTRNQGADGAAYTPGPTRVNSVDDSASSPRTTRISGDSPGAPGASAAMGEEPRAAPQRRQTQVFTDPSAGTPVHRGQGHGRRLTGVVFTFSWSALGQLYQVHEGRNYVGSGVVSHEGGRAADVLVAEDQTLSSAHFLILCQGRDKYRISDNNSTNGTYVNGDLIDNLGIDLVDGALILAGGTVFTFQKVRPPSGMPAATQAVDDTDERARTEAQQAFRSRNEPPSI